MEIKSGKELKERWIAALRSGEYKQCKGRLHQVIRNHKDYGGYCCLGVFCRVNGMPISADGLYIVDSSYKFVQDYSPIEARIKAYSTHGFVCKNDGLDWDFNKIADYIEKNVEFTDIE